MQSILSVSEINDQNLLDIDVRPRKKDFSDRTFGAVIDYIYKVGAILREIQDDGHADLVVDLRNFYLDTLRWLKGQDQTTNWISIAPLRANESNTQGSINQYLVSYFPNFKNTMSSNATFSMYFDRRNSRRQLHIEDAKEELRTEYNELNLKIEETANAKMSSITAAAALEQWQKYFDELLGNEEEVPKGFWKRMRYYWKDNSAGYSRQLGHNKLWKNVWLIVFVLAQLIFIFIYLLVWHWNPSEHVLELLTIKLAMGLLFGTLFVSSNKNYRIYANLYDQAKFRSTVAKTIQGVLLDDERILPENKAVLLTVAAQSLFEMKPNGHLTKKETASPMNELITAIVAKGQ